MNITKKEKVYQNTLVLLPIIGILFQGLYSGFTSTIFLLLLCILLLMKVDKTSIITLVVIALGFAVSMLLAKDIKGISEISKITILFATIFTAKENDKQNLLKGLYLGCFFASFLGVMAYLFNITSYELIRNVNGEKVIQSVFGYANTIAVFAGIGIILSIYYIKKNKNYAFANEVVCGINILCLIFTSSKLAIVSVLFALLIALCIKYPKMIKWIMIAFLAVIISVILLFVIGKEDVIIGSTLACRFIYWNDALKVIISHPFGIGIDNWQNIQYEVQSAAYSVKYVHNGFLQLGLDGGLIVLFGVLFLIGKGFFDIIIKYKNTKEDLYLYLLSILTLIVAHGFVDIDFVYGSIWLAMGIVLCFVNDGKVKINKIAFVILPVCLLITILSIPVQRENQTEKYSKQFSVSMKNNDYNNMYEISKEWVGFAPRQQSAYDAYYLSLTRLNKFDEIMALRKKVSETNKTMNYMCKYLSEHKEIILPTGGKVDENN